MSEQLLVERIVVALKKAGFTTREDIKKFATKKDLARFATKKDLRNLATKRDLSRFVTKKDLQQVGFATKKDITDALLDFWDQVLEPNMATKDEVRELKEHTDKRFNRVDVKQMELSRKVDDIRADLSDTLTRGEFESLKTKVDRYIPAH